jgi:transketolase
VEVTTGPLGQGTANAIGMAIAAKHLEAVYGSDAGFRVYAIVTDGDLMEGISSEASSLAGHLGLDNLVFLYDDNHVTSTATPRSPSPRTGTHATRRTAGTPRCHRRKRHGRDRGGGR